MVSHEKYCKGATYRILSDKTISTILAFFNLSITVTSTRSRIIHNLTKKAMKNELPVLICLIWICFNIHFQQSNSWSIKMLVYEPFTLELIAWCHRSITTLHEFKSYSRRIFLTNFISHHLFLLNLLWFNAVYLIVCWLSVLLLWFAAATACPGRFFNFFN